MDEGTGMSLEKLVTLIFIVMAFIILIVLLAIGLIIPMLSD